VGGGGASLGVARPGYHPARHPRLGHPPRPTGSDVCPLFAHFADTGDHHLGQAWQVPLPLLVAVHLPGVPGGRNRNLLCSPHRAAKGQRKGQGGRAAGQVGIRMPPHQTAVSRHATPCAKHLCVPVPHPSSHTCSPRLHVRGQLCRARSAHPPPLLPHPPPASTHLSARVQRCQTWSPPTRPAIFTTEVCPPVGHNVRGRAAAATRTMRHSTWAWCVHCALRPAVRMVHCVDHVCGWVCGV
jgi:hypothetical protein